jgi:phosphohistidine phosphatase
MRHGLAADQFDSDFTRALSSTGEKQALSIAQQLTKNESILPDKMLVSPFRRTQETADIVHKHLAMNEPYENEELLVHFADPKLLGDFLIVSEHVNLILVSHMPIVAELCQYLIPDCNIYGFQTAQLVKVEFDTKGFAKISHIYLPE